MSFSILDVKFEISVPFCVMLTFLLINDTTGLMSASLFAVVFHELGHLIAMKLTKCAPRSVKLSAAGILICGSSYCTAKENIFIAVAGPFANVVFSIGFYFLYRTFNVTLMLYFCLVQLLVGVLNVMPVKGLDGGTIIFNLLSRFPKVNAAAVCSVVSIFFACALTVIGTAVAVKNVYNPSLLLLGIYLIVLNLMKR